MFKLQRRQKCGSVIKLVLRQFMIGWVMEDQIKFSTNHKGLECYTGGLLTVSQLQVLMWLYIVS